jgi:DNA topoisomerase IB
VPDSGTGRRRAVVDALAEVAEHLGNTPAVSRSSYIDR